MNNDYSIVGNQSETMIINLDQQQSTIINHYLTMIYQQSLAITMIHHD